MLTPETVRQAAYGLMTADQLESFKRELEIDFAISEPGLGRFRVNVFYQRGYPAMVLRYISADMPKLDSLGLPDMFKDLIMMKRGLILMVGATGSGKSTSIAAMINHRNEMSSDHIVTIEDPIEFLHTNKRSIVNQREVGLDTKSLLARCAASCAPLPTSSSSVKSATRRPWRRRSTSPAPGHLVLSTLHANNSAETLDRIINMFPQDQHKQIFLDLSQYLRAILSQRLVVGKDGKRIAAIEVMLNTPYITELVEEGRRQRRSRKPSSPAPSAACRASTWRC